MGCWHVFLNFLGIISYRLFLDLNYKNIISPLHIKKLYNCSYKK